MRNRCRLFLLVPFLILTASSLLGQPNSGAYRYHQDFTSAETAGVRRTGEPVRFQFPAAASASQFGAALLWDQTNGREVPVQLALLPGGLLEVLFVADQPANSTIAYRLYYAGAEHGATRGERLRISGEDLAWQVESSRLIVDFSKNPGTGRSGQINRIFAKRPGIWLSRERDQSTLHLSPNAAGRQHYLPVNRWDPPEEWTCSPGPVSFRLERSGPMPRLPQLRARIVYEVYADSPLILVEEEIDARDTVDLTLLRVGEFTFPPDPNNHFTNLVWGNGGQAFEAGRNENPDLPVDVAWIGFIQKPANYGFVSVLAALETSAPAGGQALLLNPGTHFSGTPAHYFSRSLITNNTGEQGPSVTIPAGSRYRLRQWVFWLEPGNAEPLRALSDMWKAVKNPLRVEVLPFGVHQADENSSLHCGRTLQSPAPDSGESGHNKLPAATSDSAFGALRREREADALQALHWLGRDFSFLVPGEDGATLRAVTHDLELLIARPEASDSEFQALVAKADAFLRARNLHRRIGLSDREEPATELSLPLGYGPAPIILKIDSPAGAAPLAIVSSDVSLGAAQSQTEEISLEPAATTWLVLKVSGRPEGGESRRLRVKAGNNVCEIALRSSDVPLSTVQISFEDQATGRETPVAVRLYTDSGRLIVPAGTLDFGRLGFLYEEDRPVHYADWSSARVRSLDPHFGSSFFRSRPVPESACFYVDRELTTRLPPGTYRLTATRGLEYKPSSLVITVLPGQPFHSSVKLKRWTNMAELGWYSGDGHVHAERATPEINDLISTWAAAEDVAFCNVLLMGDEERTYYPQYAYGTPGRHTDRGTVLAPGQEDPRTAELGHTLHLNLQAPVRSPDRYADYGAVFSRTRREGALTGFAHVGRQRWYFNAERGLTLLAPLGLVDFAEIAQMGYIGVERWFDFLNLGFRLTAMAGSDVPWGGTLGNTRVYAYTGRPFSPEAWVEAVRKGRTFVTTGPMLEFTVNGEIPGSLLPLSRGQKIQVSARAWGWGPHQPETVEIIVSGEAVQTAKRREGHESLAVDLEFPASRSVWVTALARTAPGELMGSPGFFQGAVATPVYVQVEGESWIDQRLVSKLVGERLNDLAAIEEWLGANRTAAQRETIEQARRYYRTIGK